MVLGLMLATCNIFSGVGFDKAFLGSWSKAFMGILIMFFILLLSRKWLFEEALGLPFNIIIAEALGIISYIVIVNLFCSYKIALVVGLAVGFVGGWLLSGLLGDFGSGGENNG